jgi:hypothetical protein
MNRKYVGYALTIAGIVLIIVGVLNVSGYLNLQVVDTNPPKILYTFPANGMTYSTTDLTEIVIYAKDDSDVASATYFDRYFTQMLSVTPYTQLKHPLQITGWKYPDVNFDGRVDTTDYNIVYPLRGAEKGDSRYNPAYDLNSDGIIDGKDLSLISNYWFTVTFAVFITPPYSIAENITFSFVALDKYENSATFSGWFTTGQFELLSGKWKINGVSVTDNTLLETSDRKVTVTFTCNDTSVSASSISVKATVGSTIHMLTFIGNYTWTTTIDLSPGENSLILEASVTTTTPPKLNKISVTVKTPELQTFTIGHALIFAGAILIIGGIIVLRKEEEAW